MMRNGFFLLLLYCFLFVLGCADSNKTICYSVKSWSSKYPTNYCITDMGDSIKVVTETWHGNVSTSYYKKDK